MSSRQLRGPAVGPAAAWIDSTHPALSPTAPGSTRCPGHYDRRTLQARRILLFFGILLLLTAAAASFVPVPTEPPRDGGETQPADGRGTSPEAEPGPGDTAPDDAVTVRFDAGEEPRTETVLEGTQVIVTVVASEPGEVELEGLGRFANVEEETPALLDLFTDQTGRFDVLLTPVEGQERRIGTLVVSREEADRPD